MDGGRTFDVHVGTLRTQAQEFFGESENLAQLVTDLDAVGTVNTGDGGLDGLVARLVDEIKSSVGGGGMALESDGQGLLTTARNYEAADGTLR
jgi:hypothetical protein